MTGLVWGNKYHQLCGWIAQLFRIPCTHSVENECIQEQISYKNRSVKVQDNRVYADLVSKVNTP